MRSYVLGSELVFATQFVDPITDMPASPTSVTLEFMDPNGLTVPATPQQSGVGSYRAAVLPTVPGIWTFRWAGTGAVVAATEGKFEVVPSALIGSTS